MSGSKSKLKNLPRFAGVWLDAPASPPVVLDTHTGAVPTTGKNVTPLVGVTTYREQAQTGAWDVEASFLPATYIDAIREAHAIAILFPPQDVTRAEAEAMLDAVDGLVLSGGVDVDPARYGETPGPHTDTPRKSRDELDFMLAEIALARNLPLLGICRGMQVLNVVRGGSLIQHLPDVVGSDHYRPGAGVFGTLPVQLEKGSELATIYGETERDVPVYHHQAVKTLGRGLHVTATSADGIVQAVEADGPDFAVGVQWHPEAAAGGDAALFHRFVQAARVHASTRVG